MKCEKCNKSNLTKLELRCHGDWGMNDVFMRISKDANDNSSNEKRVEYSLYGCLECKTISFHLDDQYINTHNEELTKKQNILEMIVVIDALINKIDSKLNALNKITEDENQTMKNINTAKDEQNILQKEKSQLIIDKTEISRIEIGVKTTFRNIRDSLENDKYNKYLEKYLNLK